MSVTWEDVNARARGLGSRLLSPAVLARLGRIRDLQALARAMAEEGAVLEEVPNATAPALELALRRAAGRALAVARRWLGARAEVVAIALEAEDRRSLRALVRGAAAGVHAEARLTGLVPTPSLPERLLRELAERSQIREQAALLVAAGNAYGPPILAVAAQQEPDLFAIELAIGRTFAQRALQGARRDGGFLRAYVGDLIDIDNCRNLLLAGRESGERFLPAFIPGGRRLAADGFERAGRAAGTAAVARALGEAMGGGPTAALLVRHAGAPASLEEAFKAEVRVRLFRESRLDPLGPAPLLLYCERLREQTVVLSDLVWRLDLGAPAPAERTE